MLSNRRPRVDLTEYLPRLGVQCRHDVHLPLPPERQHSSLITTIFLIAIALAVTVSPVVYNTLERVELVLVAIIVVFRLIARS